MDLKSLGLVPHVCKTVPVGVRFGRLTILAIGKPPGTYVYTAVCRCDCGTGPLKVRIQALVSGHTIGCGCARGAHLRTHGLSRHPLYNVWIHMIKRCSDPKNAAFQNYGGRGIRVCERWSKFENFFADMERAYRPGLTIDREDNDGDYEPSNCRWANDVQQSENRRVAISLTFDGRTQSLKAWAKELSFNYSTLRNRVQLYGWPAERALTTAAATQSENMRNARKERWPKS